MRCCISAVFSFLIASSTVLAQASVIPPGNANPVLRVEAGGPTSLVNAMAFSPDGRTLYTSGWDKVVRVWRLDAQGQWWRPAPALRVPLGPGADGKINAIAVSPDGNWLAVAGSGAVRARAGFRDVGIVVPSGVMSTAMREDQGVIYVFNVNSRTTRVLRGLRGPVFALTFAAPEPGAAKDVPPPLVAATRERQDKGNYRGVVWLWDPAKGTHQAWPAPLPDVGAMGRPGLATWRSDGEKKLHIALAWEDKVFRVWDVARGKDGVMEQKDGKYNITVAAFPGNTLRSPARLLTGALRDAGGYLQEWNVAAEMAPAAQLPDASKDGKRGVPLALALVSSRPGKAPDHAAVALYVQDGKQTQMRLEVLALDPAHLGVVKVDMLLWPFHGSLPTLAAVPGGKYLAISDPEDAEGHGILVYDVPDLLARKSQAQPWRLSGVGETFRSVAFVRGAKGPGLRLNEKAGAEPGSPPHMQPQQDDVFFDFAKPGFVAGGAWKVDAPDLQNWTVRRQARKIGKEEQSVFQIDGSDNSRTIPLAAGQRVTDYAFLPAGPASKVALLAVAVTQLGEPALLLYDAGAGKLVRQFTGHDDIIRSLAFSADGKLLVSAGDDQTVCLWSLTDLPQILGKHGMLAGLAVKDHAKSGVVVERVDKTRSAADRLAPGDVIEGLVVDGKLKPATSARAFYTAIWERKPGARVVLQVTNKGRVELPVDQAVDERQPLVTLFSTRADKAGARDWIAWNPQGPYTDSGRPAESLLGWHINTGKPDAPTSFAKAGEYRARYFKEGLLNHLVGHAALAPALEDLKKEEEARLPSDPHVLVRIGDELLDATRADEKGHMPVQPRELLAHVKVDDFPVELVKSVQLTVDGKPVNKVESSSATEWSAPLPIWQSGEHVLHVQIQTPEARRPAYSIGPMKIRYQPPAPLLTTELPRRQVVSLPEFKLRAKVTSELDGQEVLVTVSANGKSTPPVAYTPGSAGREINVPLELQRGDNLIEIQAVNKNALAGHESNETARLALEVIYDPQTPQIVFDEVVPLQAGNRPGSSQPVTPGTVVIVNVPRVRVRGTIQATENLTAVEMNSQPLEGFAPGKKTEKIDAVVTLPTPGPQKITCLVRTKNARAARSLDIEYRPQLPSVVFLPPPGGLVFYDDGKGVPEVALRFQMQPPQDSPPFPHKTETAVLINGRRQPAPPAVDPKTNVLTVKFRPEVRDNGVQVRLSAPWAEPRNSDSISVEYLRVPYGIEFVKPPSASEAPEVELAARVYSPLPLRAGDIRATVMNRPIQNIAVEKQDVRTWLVRLKQVSLDGTKGKKSDIRLEAANADGKCQKAAECSVIYRGPPPKRADVAIVAPATGINVTEPAIRVRFRVSSDSPLQQVSLVNEATETVQPVDLSALKPDAQGIREGSAEFALAPGVNRLHVSVRNEAGEQFSPTAVVSFLPPPVRVLLDQVEPLEGGPLVTVQTLADGRLSPTAPQGRLLLHGRVVWTQDRDERLKGIERMIVRVNGVQQVDPVRLQPPTADRPRERAFQVRVFLNHADSNRLEMELPGLPQEDADQKVYLASCARPVPAKRMLHLLIIGIGAKDGSSVKNQVLAALGATSIHGNEFALPAFDQAVVYGPLIDRVRPVDRTDVFGKFLTIKKTMDALARKDLYTHVVMVYYQGNEVISDKGYFLRTSGPEVDPGLQFYRIPFENLEKLITESRGAQVLLMDVARESGGKVSAVAASDGDIQLFSDSHAAIMRYARLGKGPSAPQASLIGALERSLRKASRLSKVEELVAERFDQLRKVQETPVLYSRFIPPSLADLVIGPAVK